MIDPWLLFCQCENGDCDHCPDGQFGQCPNPPEHGQGQRGDVMSAVRAFLLAFAFGGVTTLAAELESGQGIVVSFAVFWAVMFDNLWRTETEEEER